MIENPHENSYNNININSYRIDSSLMCTHIVSHCNVTLVISLTYSSNSNALNVTVWRKRCTLYYMYSRCVWWHGWWTACRPPRDAYGRVRGTLLVLGPARLVSCADTTVCKQQARGPRRRLESAPAAPSSSTPSLTVLCLLQRPSRTLPARGGCTTTLNKKLPEHVFL